MTKRESVVETAKSGHVMSKVEEKILLIIQVLNSLI